MTTPALLRASLPVIAGIAGAFLLIYSPLSHQAFCSPVRVVVDPVAPAPMPGHITGDFN